jgi:5-methylcytosine-specific restriction enzyme subunit McrC
MVRRIELREGARHDFAEDFLSDAEARALSDSRVVVVDYPTPLNGRRYILRSINLVGQRRIAPGIDVAILPKAPIDSIIALLELVYDLRSLHIHNHLSSAGSVDDVFERLAHVLARRILHRLAAGIYHEYQPVEAQIGRVRGRINALPTAINVANGRPIVDCRFSELTADIDDNVILLWTMRTLLLTGIERVEVRTDLQRAHRALAGIVSERRVSSAACIGRSYSRLNQDYATMHALCAMFLDAVAPDVHAGATRTLPFELNMANLFERFVAEWLKRAVSPKVSVATHRVINLGPTHADAFKLNIDLVLSDPVTGEVLCVIDTKYKMDERPSQADVNQVVVYALELGAKHAVLAYPFEVQAPVSVTARDIRVSTLSFDLAQPVEAAGAAFLQKLGEMGAIRCMPRESSAEAAGGRR